MEDRSLDSGLRLERASASTYTALGIIELIVGLFASSIALTSDGVGSIADAAVSFIAWLGLKMSRKDRDDKFHFGYYRVETFASMLSAIIMIVMGFLILHSSYVTLTRHVPIKAVLPAAAAALLAAVPSFYFGYKKRQIGGSTKWASISLDSYNSIIGGIASVIALIGILISGFGFYGGDAVAGMLIAGLIFITAYSAFKEGSLSLMDACMCPDVLEVVHNTVKSVEGVEGIHDIRLRRAGPYLTGEVHAVVDGNITVSRGNEIATQVETSLKNSLGEIHMITVKVEPKNGEAQNPLPP